MACRLRPFASVAACAFTPCTPSVLHTQGVAGLAGGEQLLVVVLLLATRDQRLECRLVDARVHVRGDDMSACAADECESMSYI